MNGTTIQIDTVPPLENLYLKLLSSETETSQHITAGECFAVCVTCARGLPRYIKINIPTYSRRPPLTEKSLGGGGGADGGCHRLQSSQGGGYDQVWLTKRRLSRVGGVLRIQ